MTQFNPLAGAILQSPVVQQQQSADKNAQLRRADALEKNAAVEDDEMEHQVESSEEVTPVDDGNDTQGENPKKRGKKPYQGEDGREHVDLTA